MKSKTSNRNNHKYLLWFLVVFVFLAWALSGVIIFYLASNWTDRGTIGDMFGAVNALFSGLAFVGLIYTILMQREEIKLNRKEIEMNRRELKKSSEAQQQSQQALKDQVIQTHLTAKINAMSTVINYYNTQISNPNNNEEVISRAKMKRKVLITSIDELIEGMNDSNIDD